MDNLWQKLKPTVKTKILANKDEYPYLVEDVKSRLKNSNFWSELPINTVRNVVSFTHDSVYDISMTDFLWGDSFIKKSKI
jgi:hypothetical protein